MHTHGGSVSDGGSKEQSIALLAYMIEHNKIHMEELHEAAHGTTGEAARLIHEAIDEFDQGNQKLSSALAILKEE